MLDAYIEWLQAAINIFESSFFNQGGSAPIKNVDFILFVSTAASVNCTFFGFWSTVQSQRERLQIGSGAHTYKKSENGYSVLSSHEVVEKRLPQHEVSDMLHGHFGFSNVNFSSRGQFRAR